jgi:tRNA pseudouridine55 synthase
MHGWLVIDKPAGLGSTGAVAAVKRALREGGYGKVKVGHGGTLDPLASGVLPVALGEATKLAGRLLDSDKIYEFTIAFGVETDTLDGEGTAVATSDRRPTLAAIEAVLPRFTGPIGQVPPAYSALKVGGRRAYRRARAGEEVEIPARRVIVHSLRILPGIGKDRVSLTARVSKGTYIRSLARDLARALESRGHVVMLRRTGAGPFTLEQAISLDKMSQAAKSCSLETHLLPLTAGLDDIPALPVTPDQARLLREGRKLDGIAAKPGLHLATDHDIPVALVELEDGSLRVLRGFNLVSKGI